MDWLGTTVSIIGSGALGSVITAFAMKKKSDAEANSTNVSSILEVDARLNERMAKLEERVANLEAENIKLKEENLALKLKLGMEPEEVFEPGN